MNEPEEQCSCCCSGSEGSTAEPESSQTTSSELGEWVTGFQQTPIGNVPVVNTQLSPSDRWGACKVRWGIGRLRYRVEPAVYAVGDPTPESPVLVSANYKLSFDHLRSKLGGLDAWILVLDTKGVNVWCAAGKGTFGTDELVQRIESVRLAELVTHRRVIVPQLGAPGVAAHDVHDRCGFRVVFGPVRAEDTLSFLGNGMHATPEMRLVRFPLSHRLAVAPIEFVMSAKFVGAIVLVMLLLGGFGPGGFSGERVVTHGLFSGVLFAVSCGMAIFLTSALLPWLPGRALSLKGLWIGIGILLGLAGASGQSELLALSGLDWAAWCLLIPATTSFLAMNFTGATTYTSLSGVRREMRVAVPIQALGAGLGVVLWCVGRFV